MKRYLALLIFLVVPALPGWADGALKITGFVYHDGLPAGNPAQRQVEGRLSVHNGARTAVSGVTLMVHVRDGNGRDLDVLRKTVDRIAAGGDATFDWNWYNSANIVVRPMAEVVCRSTRVVGLPTSGAPRSPVVTNTDLTGPGAGPHSPPTTPAGYGTPGTKPDHSPRGYGTP